MSGSESPVANGYGTHAADHIPASPGDSPLNDVDADDADLFGDVDNNEQDDSLNRKLDDAELDSGDDEEREDRVARSVEGSDEDETAFSEAANLQIEIARINALKADELYIVKIPPFLGLQTENFDYHKYEPPTRPHDQTDPTDKFSAYSTATTSLMWRHDPHDSSKMQSNSRIIRWSDGSLTLQIASRPKDQYRISTKAYRQGFGAPKAQKNAALGSYDPSKDSQVYLAAAHSAVEALQIVAPVDAQLRILPTGDLSDQSIQKLQQSLAASQVVHDPLASLKQLKEDPEIARKAAELFEKDRLRSLKKRENAEDKLLTKRDRVLGRSGLGRSGGLSVAGLEADEDGMPRSSAFKSKQAKRRGNRRGDIYSDDEDEDLPRGRTREDEYDLDDGFMAGSDEEIETYEDESAEEQDPDVDDLEIEGRKTVVKEKTRGGLRSPSPQKRAAEDDGTGEGSPGQARKKRTRIIDDDDDDDDLVNATVSFVAYRSFISFCALNQRRPDDYSLLLISSLKTVCGCEGRSRAFDVESSGSTPEAVWKVPSRNFSGRGGEIMSLRRNKDRAPKIPRRFSDKPEHFLSPASLQSTFPTSRSTTSIHETSGLSPANPENQARRPLLTREALERLDSENDRQKYKSPSPSTYLEAHMRKSKKSEKRKAKPDKNSHPLNLPPDQLRQLSAAMAEVNANGDSMDVDEPQVPTSPVKTSPPVTPSQSAPGAFPDSTTNGDTNGVNGHDEKSPTPPPHKEPPLPPVDAEACKAAGNKFFKAKDYPRAIMEYTKAVEAEPSNPTYLSNRAAAYISANKYDLALSDSLQANRLDPANDKILHRLARIYTSLGRPQDALETYARIPGGASAKDTSLAKTAISAVKSAERAIEEEGGSGTMALWNLDQAKQTLGSGVPWPRRWQILRARANLKIGSANSLGEVQGIATSMQRESSNDAEALVLAGRALYLRGEPKSHPGAKSDFQKAEECFKQALAMDPDMIEALKSLRLMRRLEKAKEDANNVFKAKRYSEAVKAYSDALLVDPSAKMTNAKLLGNRAMARMRIKEFDEAIADCDAAVKADPTYLKAKKTRAKAVGEGGNWEQAVKDLKDIAEADPTPENQKEVRNAEMELKKSKRKDYYKILGVEKDADEPQIKRAYKKKALSCHPDKFPGDNAKEEEFKDLTEANETLMDPEKRQRYDSGVDLMDPSDHFGGGMGGHPFGGGMPGGLDPDMIFNMMGGGGRGGGMPHFSFSQNGGGGRGGGFPF